MRQRNISVFFFKKSIYLKKRDLKKSQNELNEFGRKPERSVL